MGNCANNPQNEDLIQEYLAVTKQKDPDHTILILGTSNSGKSIIFRHIESLYDKDTNHYIQDIIIAFAHESHLSKWVPSDIVNLCTNFLNPLEIKEFNEEGDETGTKHYTRKENKDIVQYLGNYETSQQLIRHNCISAMMTLYNKCEEFSTEPYNLDECAIDPNDEEIANTIKTILPYTDVQDFDRTFNRGHAEEYAQLGDALESLWRLDAIQAIFKYRRCFYLEENVEYFMNKVKEIFDESEMNKYEPTLDDLWHMRCRTTGIIEKNYIIEEQQYKIYDAGGTRNERKKWINIFEKVDGFIFVASLTNYCCLLFEDETTNAMAESLELFDLIINGRWFNSKYTQFTLLLTKDDIFRDLLKKVPLTYYFGDEYQGRNYVEFGSEMDETDEKNEEYFQECYNDAVDFIQNKYLERNKHPEMTSVSVHITTATERSNIERIFKDVTMNIISNSLKASEYDV